MVSWSPDGQTLAFNECCSSLDALELIDRDGSNLRVVTKPPMSGYAPTWTPDGSTIVYQGRNARSFAVSALS